MKTQDVIEYELRDAMQLFVNTLYLRKADPEADRMVRRWGYYLIALIEQVIERKRKRGLMYAIRRLVLMVGVLVLVGALLVGGPTGLLAQDELLVPDEPGVDVPGAGGPGVMTAQDWVLVVVIVVLLATILLVQRPLITQLGASLPPWALDPLMAMLKQMAEERREAARRTDTKIDDEVTEELVILLRDLHDEMIRQRKGEALTARRDLTAPAGLGQPAPADER